MPTDMRSHEFIEPVAGQSIQKAMAGIRGQQRALLLDGSAQAFFW